MYIHIFKRKNNIFSKYLYLLQFFFKQLVVTLSIHILSICYDNCAFIITYYFIEINNFITVNWHV